MTNFDQDTIQRCPHDPENPYAQISRQLIRDKSISPECRWVLIYLLSMKDGWTINVTQIYNHVKEFIGRDRVYQLIGEAVEAGYIKKIINKVGNLNRGCTYYISESPKFKKCFRHPESQDAEPRDPENQEALSKIISSSSEEDKDEHLKGKEINKEKGLAPLKPRSSPPSKRKSVKEESKEMASRVLITPSQHADLVKRAKDDEKLVQQWYDRLSQWKIGKEIEGGKDYSAITNWVIDAVKEKPSLQKPSESNKEWAIKKIDELNNMGAIERSRATVNVESESVSVSFKGYGPQADKFLKFSEHGFKDQLTNLFNKIGITMPNL